jgi:LytS/YehU family sensor histidine kinase
MILQTLVENSIKHGISHSVKGGKIEILMEKTGEQLCIRVINPGHLKTKGMRSAWEWRILAIGFGCCMGKPLN